MNIAKYPFAVLSAALFTVMLMTPISSLSNLIWLASVDMPIGIISSREVILFDKAIRGKQSNEKHKIWR